MLRSGLLRSVVEEVWRSHIEVRRVMMAVLSCNRRKIKQLI